MDLCLLSTIAAASVIVSRKPKRKRKTWVKDWLLERKRCGDMVLLKQLQNEAHDWRNYLRMDETSFVNLLNMVTPLIRKEDTVMRDSITPYERLTATLRFLATGRSYEDLKFSNKISAKSLSKIIPETCRAISHVLRGKYIDFPDSKEKWINISKEFYEKWDFPNCLGAVDGKHVAIVQPHRSGSYFYNYKGYHSLVLMAIADANYEFIYCNVGTNGRVSDGGVIENTDFYHDLINVNLNLPLPAPPENSDFPLPFVFLGDEAFKLQTDSLKPFSQTSLNNQRIVFNKRLSRARHCIECTFGILASRFRVFLTTINLKLDHIQDVVLACCSLHNYLRRKSVNYFVGSDYTNNVSNCDIETFSSLQATHERNSQNEAKQVREKFAEYLNIAST